MKRLSKRDRVALWSERLGLTHVMELLPRRRPLLVFNYHRIGDGTATCYDSDVYEATAEEFDSHVRYLKAHFDILTLADAIQLVVGSKPWRGNFALITFDDGYVDNHDLAFPILCSHGVSATFFLPTAFIGTNWIPWWDSLACAVKSTKRKTIHIQYPRELEFDLENEGRNQIIRHLLGIYKAPTLEDPRRFLSNVVAACDVSEPLKSDRLFLTWDEVSAMVAGGMDVGSHAHSHELLSRMTEAEQYEELCHSRAILEHKLGIVITALAYPVGDRTAFSAVTQKALERAGYRIGFSYYGGVNLEGQADPYDIKRIGLDAGMLQARYRFQTAFAAVLGRQWG